MKFKHLLFALLFTLLSFPNLEAQTVERGPYIQLGTTSSIIVRWRTNTSTQSKVWYGTNPDNLSQMASSSGTTDEHEVLIDGLDPATIYYYKIGDNGGPYTPLHGTQYFKTHPEENGIDQPIRAWMLGNAGTLEPEQRDVRDSYYNVIGDSHIDMILFTGDNAYDDGKDYEYQAAVFEDMYEARLVNSLAWSCFGNHDAGDADSEDESGTYYEIFNFPRDGQSGGVASGTEAYYSFDYGNMHVISLNTQDVPRETGDDMIVWLEADLAANQKKWIVTILHHRPYTGSNNNDSDIDEKPTDVRTYMLPLLEAGGCDLVLSSHSHNYQRSFLINGHYGTSDTFDEDDHGVDMGDGQSDGDGAYSKVNSNIGTVYVVAGTAGTTSSSSGLNHPVMYYNSGTAGSVQLLISDEELNFQFINEDEEIEDYFTIEKSPSVIVSGFHITSPTEGETFIPQQNITITADTTGTLINVDQVDFYVDNVLIGSDNTDPFSQVWTVPGVGDYQIKAIAREASGSATEQDVVNISAGPQEICATISNGHDDGEERVSGNVNTTSSDLELVVDSDVQKIGLRFVNANIPDDVQIDSAFIQFTVDESKNVNPCLFQIYGEKSLNPANYNGPDFNISDRTKTNVNVNWTPDVWDDEGDAGAAQRTPNIASVIQEIIDQPGYNGSQALAFIIEGTGKRVAESYDSGAEVAPQLCVHYSPNNVCPGLQEPIGSPCDDNNPNTYDDVITTNCDCTGTPYDCPTFQADVGSPCDDNNDGTYNDIVTVNCNCIGTPYDCPSLQADIAAPCNDNNNGTYNDVVTANCDCTGTPYDCPTLQANIGASCNDNNNGTYNDVVTANCDCTGTPYDCPSLQADIAAPCNDNNGGTYDDLVTANCECVGIPYDCPVLQANVGDGCDDGNPVTGNDEVTANCNCEGIIIENEVTVTGFVISGDDDAEEKLIGDVSLSSSDLELVVDDQEQVIGIRFSGMNIPEYATIVDAYIQFTVDETVSIDPCLMTISGEAADTPLSFSNQDYNISSRAKTNTSVTWAPVPWEAIGDNGVAQRTSILTSIVQELISRPGYAPGNAMAFIIEGQGKRVAESYDGEPEKAPKLYVTFVSSCDDDDGDGVCNGQDLCDGSEPGTPCDDGNSETYSDVVNENCLCEGVLFDCPTLVMNIGDPCDDGNSNTIDDVVDSNCACTGIDIGCSNPITVAGNALLVVSNSGVANASQILGSPNTVAAKFYDNEDQLVVELNDLVTAGEDVTISWKYRNYISSYSGPAMLDVYESEDGNTFTFNTTLSTSEQIIFINSNITLTSNALYLKLVNASTADDTSPDFDVDALSYSFITCPPTCTAFIEHINSIDASDCNTNDGQIVVDPNESLGTVLPFDIQYTFNGQTITAGPFNNAGDNFITGLAPGNYSNITLIDANGCTANGASLTINCTSVGGGGTTTVCASIANGSDDAEEEDPYGSVNTGSSDIEMMVEDELQQWVGFRFLNLNIPQGAIIQEASIQFTADETNNIDPCELSIYGEAADNPISFDDSDFNLSNRTRTNTSVSWTPPLWTVKGAAGPAEQTADISPVLQEVVNRNGYSENSAVVIMMNGIGKRVAESFDGSADQAAILCVTYSMPISPPMGMMSNDNGEPLLRMNRTAGRAEVDIKSENDDGVALSALKIFPNPTKDQINLTFSSFVEMETEVHILHMNGQLLKVENHQIVVGNNQLTISNLNLSNGVYIVKLKEQNGWQSIRFVVLK